VSTKGQALLCADFSKNNTTVFRRAEPSTIINMKKAETLPAQQQPGDERMFDRYG
jgi:hypothetical protein